MIRGEKTVWRIGAPIREKESLRMTDRNRSSSGRSSYGKTSLIDDITTNTQGYSRRQVAEIVDTALDMIKQKVSQGQNVTLTGFGTFRRSERAARTGTNIRTRERIQIPAQKSVRFTAGSEFKSAVGGRSASRSGTRQRERGSSR
jgi:DNA-binding protein HU-beta